MTGRSSGKVSGKSQSLASDFLVELLMATLDKTTLKRTKSPKAIIYTSAIEKSVLGKSKTFSEKDTVTVYNRIHTAQTTLAISPLVYGYTMC
jgi:hypothetical protein